MNIYFLVVTFLCFGNAFVKSISNGFGRSSLMSDSFNFTSVLDNLSKQGICKNVHKVAAITTIHNSSQQLIDKLTRVKKCLLDKGHPKNESYERDFLCRLHISLDRIEVFGHAVKQLHDIVNEHENSYFGCKINLNAKNLQLLKELKEEAITFTVERKDLQAIEEHLQVTVREKKKFDENSRMVIMQTLRDIEWRLTDMYNKIDQVEVIPIAPIDNGILHLDNVVRTLKEKYAAQNSSSYNNRKVQDLFPEKLSNRKHLSKKRVLPEWGKSSKKVDTELLGQLKTAQNLHQKDNKTDTRYQISGRDEDQKQFVNHSTTPITYNQTHLITSTPVSLAPETFSIDQYHQSSESPPITVNYTSANSAEQEETYSIDNTTIIESIALGIFLLADIILAAYCMRKKYQGKITNPLINVNDQEKMRCYRFCNYLCCCKPKNPPYRIISVQDIGNIDNRAQSSDSDFFFNDEYLELNDCDGAVPPLTNVKPANYNATNNTDCDEEDFEMEDEKTSIFKGKNKVTYVRLNDANDDNKKSSSSYVMSQISRGYWNPRYFSLVEETDV